MVPAIWGCVLKDLQILQSRYEILSIHDALVTATLDQELQYCKRLHSLAQYQNHPKQNCQCLLSEHAKRRQSAPCTHFSTSCLGIQGETQQQPAGTILQDNQRFMQLRCAL